MTAETFMFVKGVVWSIEDHGQWIDVKITERSTYVKKVGKS